MITMTFPYLLMITAQLLYFNEIDLLKVKGTQDECMFDYWALKVASSALEKYSYHLRFSSFSHLTTQTSVYLIRILCDTSTQSTASL